MNNIQLSNGHLTAEISQHGAELVSVRNNGFEHIWQADPQYWKRHAPVLFPIVGKVWDDSYRVNGKVYHLPQHGFARDSDFQLAEASDTAATLRLESSEETLQRYPYPFSLTARYELCGSTLKTLWTVENRGSEGMCFQIGAHPAFRYRQYEAQDEEHGFLRLFKGDEAVEELSAALLGDSGCVRSDREPIAIGLHDTQGLLPLTADTFKHGALVLEGRQADRAVMYDRELHPVAEMHFDAPVLGIWSPVNAPFCCIEPWYGRADKEGFSGSIEQRHYIQHLEPGKRFEFGYETKFFCN